MVAPGEEFPLREGELKGVAGGSFAIRFERVLEDSRCPMNARCIWEGNARIAIRAGSFPRGKVARERDSLHSMLELNTSERFARRASFRENAKAITVELRGLEPTPMAGVPTRDYVATLVVEVEQ